MKESVDLILKHGIVLTMDSDFTVFRDGAVAVKGQSIVAVGPTGDILDDYEAAELVDCSDQVIIPGLINAHTHIPMTLLRGLADDLRLDVWLTGYMMPVEREFVDPEFVDLGTRLGCAEMIRTGVTTFCDMYYYETDVAKATADAGMRAIAGQTILKFPSPDSSSYEAALATCRTFIEDWKGHPLIIPAVAPHAPYTTTPEILTACRDLALEYDVPVHIHISETALEVENSRTEHGMPVVPWIKKHGLTDAKVIAAHCVHIDRGEIRTLANTGTGIAHNPSSNLKLASGIAPVMEMLRSGAQVGIGTDGPASNNDLDMIEETRLAAFISKVKEDDPTSLPAKTALAMATSMGARALHIGDITGSLEVGKRADIAIMDLRRVHNWPTFKRDTDSIYSQIVYAAKSTDVVSVLCDGQWLMRDHNLTTLNEDDLFDHALDIAGQIDTFLIQREGDIYSKLLALGEMQREESFEVQVKARVDGQDAIDRLLEHPDVEMVKHTHYKQYDTYFIFAADEGRRVRYREDYNQLSDKLGADAVRSRLTLTDNEVEQEFSHSIVLSRSRFISSATRPLRFYREYFQPDHEEAFTKERLRWHIKYHDLLFYVNLDKLIEPTFDGYFLEIKSRTWSLTDAQSKVDMIRQMLEILNVPEDALIRQEYISIVSE